MSALTESERLWRTLYGKDGRTLEKQPVFAFTKSLFVHRYNEESAWNCEGAQSSRNGAPRILRLPLDWARNVMDMEELAALLRQSNSDVDEAIGQLQTATNKIRAFRDVLSPELQANIRQMREHRMATETEMKATLEWLKTVRDFFLEKSYEKEMERLKEFIAVAKQLKALKDDGTLDAVADLALTLAAGREGK